MKLQPCTPDNALLQLDLESAAEHKGIERVRIMEYDDGYYVIVNMKSAKKRDRYLMTRRDKAAEVWRPRKFIELRRLRNMLKKYIPVSIIEMHHDQELPPNVTAKMMKLPK